MPHRWPEADGHPCAGNGWEARFSSANKEPRGLNVGRELHMDILRQDRLFEEPNVRIVRVANRRILQKDDLATDSTDHGLSNLYVSALGSGVTASDEIDFPLAETRGPHEAPKIRARRPRGQDVVVVLENVVVVV